MKMETSVEKEGSVGGDEIDEDAHNDPPETLKEVYDEEENEEKGSGIEETVSLLEEKAEEEEEEDSVFNEQENCKHNIENAIIALSDPNQNHVSKFNKNQVVKENGEYLKTHEFQKLTSNEATQTSDVEDNMICTGKYTKCFRNKLLDLLLGLVVGCLVCTAYLVWHFVHEDKQPFQPTGQTPSLDVQPTPDIKPVILDSSVFTVKSNFRTPTVRTKSTLYVGVLTLQHYLLSRAASCNTTWARSKYISKVEFFAQLAPLTKVDLPIVNLTGSLGSDVFHSRKSFKMLEHICENHLERYDWFMRSVDDAFVRPDKLHSLLSRLNPEEKIYIGHPTRRTHSHESHLNDNRLYCDGGPGVIFSRKALQGLCPHIKTCMILYNDGAADAELGRCVNTFLGLQCRKAPKIREYFVNSHYLSTFHLAEEFLQKGDAVSMHPVKSKWLMEALHNQQTQGHLQKLTQRIKLLENRQARLKEFLKPWNRTISPNTNTRSNHRGHPITVYHSHMLATKVRGYVKNRNASAAQVKDINDIVRRSNISFRYGNLFECWHLVDVQERLSDISIEYNASMVCNDIKESSENLTRISWKKPLKAPQLQRVKQRSLSPTLVVFLHIQYGDPYLLQFLVMWRNLLHGESSDNYMLVLLIFFSDDHIYDATDELPSLKDLLDELKLWQRARNVNIKAYHFPSNGMMDVSHKVALRGLPDQFKNSVIILTNANLRFDQTFLQKCKILVREGRQIYSPFIEHKEVVPQGTASGEIRHLINMAWGKYYAPVCIHSKDLLKDSIHSSSSTNHKQLKPFKVVNALDSSVHLDIIR